jgi:hypothetical protein
MAEPVLDIGRQSGFVLANGTAHDHIFPDIQICKNPASLGRNRNAAPASVLNRQTGNIFTGKTDLSTGTCAAGDGRQRGGFTRTIWAQQGDTLPLLDLQINAMNGLDQSVKHFE